MANIRKSFNFRSGVQVDDDNLIVNPLGLVGIGTTVPTESLDVRGTVKVVGILTATTGFVTSLTVKDLIVTGEQDISGGFVGSGVSISSGIVTSSSSTGIVTYYGDGVHLTNLPTSQWTDIDVGLGFTSIYNIGYVGVGTNDPRHPFQIGGNNSATLIDGVGFSSTGHIHATGIVTAGGGFIGTVSGNLYGELYSVGLNTIGMSDATSINITGVATAAGGFIGGLSGDVQGNLNGNVNSTGVSTFTDLTVTAGTVTIAAGIITASKFDGDIEGQILNNATGTSSTITKLNTYEIDASGGQFICGVVTATHSNLGILTASSIRTTSIGMGIPVSEKSIEIYKTGISTVEITGTERAELILGQQSSSTTGFGQSTAYIRFGNQEKTLDIINADYGDVNVYLNSANVAGVNTGAFNWIDGRANEKRMTLTHDGKLGIGRTDPNALLDVSGIASVSQGLRVGGNIDCDGTITGSFNIPFLTGTPINNTTGVSTFYDLDVTGNIVGISTIGLGTDLPLPGIGLDSRTKKALFQQIGVGTAIAPVVPLHVVGASRLDSVGIGSFPGVDGLLTKNESVSFINAQIAVTGSQFNLDGASGIGIGTTSVKGILDFANAGIDQANARFLIPPKVSSADRVGLATAAGATIYNNTDNVLQVYNGSSWISLANYASPAYNDITDVTITSAAEGDVIGYNGSGWVNDYTVTLTTAATAQANLHTLATATYRSVEYTIQGTRGSDYHVTKIIAMHNGTTAYHNEYGTLKTGSDLATFDVDVSGGNMRLRVTPTSVTSTVWKVKFTTIKV